MLIVIGEFVHTKHYDIRPMLVFRGKFPDDSNSIHDGVAGSFNFFNSSHHTMQVWFDTVGQCTIRFIQVANRHYIADIAQHQTGKLKLIIFHIRCAVTAKNHTAVDSTENYTYCIGNSTSNHKLLIFIQDKKTHRRKNVGEGDRRGCRAEYKSIKNTITDNKNVFINVGCPAFDSKHYFANDYRKPAQN